MSEFQVTIRTDNAAFVDDDGPYEVARILRDIADQIEVSGRLSRFHTVSIRDINGDRVGGYKHKVSE